MNTERLEIRLDKELLKLLKKEAKKRGQPVSKLVRMACLNFLLTQ